MFDLKLLLENRALINQIPNIASSRNHELLTECQVFGVSGNLIWFLSRISTEQLIGQIEILTNCWCTSFRYLHQIQCFTNRQTKDQNQKPLYLPSVGTHTRAFSSSMTSQLCFFTNCEWLKKKENPCDPFQKQRFLKIWVSCCGNVPCEPNLNAGRFYFLFYHSGNMKAAVRLSLFR